MEVKEKKLQFADIKEIKHIYHTSFLKEDRMPLIMMYIMSKTKTTDFLTFYDKETLCGFIYMATIDNITFIMFFAVDAIHRSKGYGSAILEKVQETYPTNKIIVSIEPCNEKNDNFKSNMRRKQFYINNGYIDTMFALDMGGKVQEVLIKNGAFDAGEFTTFFKKYSNGMITPKIWKR